MKPFKYPTGAELYALEQLARRERAKAQAQSILAAASWLKAAARAIFFRPYAKRSTRKAAFHG
jgi:hypothetical protein